jgi:replication factor C subunit 3/5
MPLTLTPNASPHPPAQMDTGLALVDILRELHLYIFQVEMPVPVLRDLAAALADVEYNLSVGTNPRLQLAAAVGAFAAARMALVNAAS